MADPDTDRLDDHAKSKEQLVEELRALRYRVDTLTDTTTEQDREPRYARVAAGALDGLWDWDLATGRITFSPRWKAMLGYDDHEIGDSPNEWLSRMESGSRQAVRTALLEHVTGKAPAFECEYPIRHKDGRRRWMRCRGRAVRDARGAARFLSGSQADVTQQREIEERLLHEASHDRLTGLPNKEYFQHRADQAIRFSRGTNTTVAIMVLDIDRFRFINDTFGHRVADDLLTAFGRRLSTCVSVEQVVARIAGDQFAILVPGIASVNDVTRLARSVRHQVAQPFYLDIQRIFPTATIGIAMHAPRYSESGEMLRDAATALNRARSGSRVGYEVFSPPMRNVAVDRMQLETDLRFALERREFCVHYQPIVSLMDRKISGFEALVRWQHPTRGLIQPDAFIPLAEATGLIVPIGWWVLHQACKQVREWQRACPREEPLTLSVNLSGLQFMEPDIVERVGAILDATGFDPHTLNLEMTETMLAGNGGPDLPVLAQLRDLNVGVHMDDFGTGYSSLSQLRRYPVDALKIDRSFVVDMGGRCEDSEIVRCIIGLARDLDIRVVAEGVTTAHQADLLRDLWCQYGQGYHFSEPLDAAAAAELVRRNCTLPLAAPAGKQPTVTSLQRAG